MNVRHTIAKNAAKYIENGMFVNLGVGIPTLAANYVDSNIDYLLHAENGFAGQDEVIPFPWGTDLSDQKKLDDCLNNFGDEQGCDWRTGHRDLVDAGLSFCKFKPGAACFDSVMSFAIVGGGHLDMTILGGLQVDQEGNLANYMVPGGRINGMGGAMDLVVGAKKVVVAMEHCTKKGLPKIVRKCNMPLTAISCINVVVTEKCVMEFREGELVVVAISPHETKESIKAVTEADIKFADELETMDIVD